MIRLRQVVLAAADRDRVVAELCSFLDVTVCFEDPGVAVFGLHNALLTIGDQFLEVVSPTTEGTTAGRLLDKRDGDGGYMAIFEVDDLDRRIEHLAQLGVRLVWAADLPDIRGRHLHPRDVGGAIVSIDQPEPPGSWRWAGPWRAHAQTEVVSAIAGVDVAAADPPQMRARWHELGIDHAVRFVSDFETLRAQITVWDDARPERGGVDGRSRRLGRVSRRTGRLWGVRLRSDAQSGANSDGFGALVVFNR